MRPGKFFRIACEENGKANKNGHFTLARRLHSIRHDGPERIR
jgi:hypothetical protein